MLLSLVYFAARRLLRLCTRGGERDDVSREIEILVLGSVKQQVGYCLGMS